MDMVKVQGQHTCICDGCGRAFRSHNKEEEVCGTCVRLIKLGLETLESIKATAAAKRN